MGLNETHWLEYVFVRNLGNIYFSRDDSQSKNYFAFVFEIL